jgi:non-ribosomal peptide synthase protein (TIGR01720 family)
MDQVTESIAVIGLAGRFPGAKNVAEFWGNVCDGVESISFFTDEELIAEGIDPAQVRAPGYVKAKGMLEDVEFFDAAFFGYSPREAEILNPQHRVFLECAWEALEVAGYGSGRNAGAVALFAGGSVNTYLLNILSTPGLLESIGFFNTMLANERDCLTTRVSYEMNLKGPSLNVQTACSTSLVAVHLACQSLLDYQCDMALAGGISITLPNKNGYLFQAGSISSPDGHCRAFDHKAQGTVSGNGVAIVVLKRVAEALRDGDSILAVVRGSAINNDGSLKVGFTAPSVEGQALVIAEAQSVAGVPADSIGYVEAHGTGTTLGDPIEVAALTRAFRSSTTRRQFCALGSVKTNIGHLDAAAGVTGLVKTVLSLRDRRLPPSLHFERAAEELKLDQSPFYVNTELREWKSDKGTPRRAGVSSFGMGGTNAHVVLEEAPAQPPSSISKRPCHLVSLSAKTEQALDQATANLLQHMKQHRDLNLADVAYTLQVGRTEFTHRRAIVCSDIDDAIAALASSDAKRVRTGVQEKKVPRIAMLFPGQGTQYVRMGRQLYESEPVFREQVDQCAELVRAELGFDLREVLFAPESEVAAESRLTQTAVTQPALFVVEYALAQLWMSWGVRPEAMIGHSLGEYVAACVAGVMTLEDALRLVALRGRLMQTLAPGAMLAVAMPERETKSLIEEFDQLSLASVNAPALCVVSGETQSIADLAPVLNQRGIWNRRLQTSHAFHSPMMTPILADFGRAVRQIKLQAPTVPFISNLTGKWIGAEATNPGYWVQHLRNTVRFSDGLSEMLRSGTRLLLEVGPGQALGTLAKRQPPQDDEKPIVLASMRGVQESESDVAFMLRTLAQLWITGVEIDWRSFYKNEKRRRVELPTYPFERQRYWIDARPFAANNRQPKPGKRPDIADWFYVPAWKQSVVPAPAGLGNGTGPKSPPHYLLFVDDCGIGERLAGRLNEQGHRVTVVHAGERFQRLGAGAYAIAPDRREDYKSLLAELDAGAMKPESFIHLWNVTPDNNATLTNEQFEQSQQRGFYSLLFLAQAIGEQALGQQTLTEVLAEHSGEDQLKLYVVSNNLQAVTGEETICAEKATLLGPARVIAQEYPQIRCRSIDVVIPAADEKREQSLIDQLLVELSLASADSVVAYRGQRRWVQTFDAVRIESTPTNNTPARLRERGVYLVTGGTGGIGLELAHFLARSVHARLILVGRTQRQDLSSTKLKRLQEIDAAGGEVLVISADVADQAAMRAAVAKGRKRFGRIDGVIHAAGIPGGGIIQLTAPDAAAAVLGPKVAGTRILESIFKDDPPDFLALFSSQRSVLGGLGRVDYCAANAYLDAFARSRASTQVQAHAPFVCSIIWDGWQETGMAVEAAHRLGVKEEDGMLNAEGIEVFKRVLGSSWSEVVVSTEDFAARIERSKTIRVANALAEAEKTRTAKPTHQRLNLQTPFVAPRTEVEETIAGIWQQLLGIEEVGVNDNFFELGGDSVLSIQIIAQANKAGLRLTPQQIFQHQTISELAAVVGSTQAIAAEQKIVTGRAPLTPIQHWFFDLNVHEPSHWNQALMLELREPLDAALLERTLAFLLAHHDALRMRFRAEDSGWIQVNAPLEEAVPFSRVNLSDLPETGKVTAIEEAAAEAQASLDLTNGPVIRLVLLDLGRETPGRLLVVAHHLIMDAISWRFLLADLATVYHQLRLAQEVSLPAKTTSFKQWAERLAKHAQSETVRREADYWLNEERRLARPLPLDFATSVETNTQGSARTLRIALDADNTRALLQEVPQVYRAQINDLLLTTLVQAFNHWTGHTSLLVDLEGHGRNGIDDLDVTRTVGWFTTIYPVLLKVSGDDAESALRDVKEQLRAIPGHGFGHGLLRYLHHDRELNEKLRRMPQAEVSFLYLGQAQHSLSESSPFVVARESSGPTTNSQARRSHLLMITGFVSGGQLRFEWTYSENLHQPSTIERLAGEYLKRLQELIDHCLSGVAKGYTPSDFPDAELSQKDLDEIMLEFSQARA